MPICLPNISTIIYENSIYNLTVWIIHTMRLLWHVYKSVCSETILCILNCFQKISLRTHSEFALMFRRIFACKTELNWIPPQSTAETLSRLIFDMECSPNAYDFQCHSDFCKRIIRGECTYTSPAASKELKESDFFDVFKLIKIYIKVALQSLGQISYRFFNIEFNINKSLHIHRAQTLNYTYT